MEDLLRLYPNSFDRLGSLKGEYDIKVDPTVPPVQHVRRKVPIESKAAIEETIDYMVKQDILEPQIEPTPWVSSVTYPVKPTGEVRSHVFHKLFMESVLLKANLVILSTGQYWLNF